MDDLPEAIAKFFHELQQQMLEIETYEYNYEPCSAKRQTTTFVNNFAIFEKNLPLARLVADVPKPEYPASIGSIIVRRVDDSGIIVHSMQNRAFVALHGNCITCTTSEGKYECVDNLRDANLMGSLLCPQNENEFITRSHVHSFSSGHILLLCSKSSWTTERWLEMWDSKTQQCIAKVGGFGFPFGSFFLPSSRGLLLVLQCLKMAVFKFDDKGVIQLDKIWNRASTVTCILDCNRIAMIHKYSAAGNLEIINLHTNTKEHNFQLHRVVVPPSCFCNLYLVAKNWVLLTCDKLWHLINVATKQECHVGAKFYGPVGVAAPGTIAYVEANVMTTVQILRAIISPPFSSIPKQLCDLQIQCTL